MLGGVKFVPRDLLEKEEDDSGRQKKKKESIKGEKHLSRKKSSKYESSSDEDIEKLKSRSGKKQKWYSSDASSSFSQDEDDDPSGSEETDEEKNSKRSRRDEKKRKHRGSKSARREKLRKKTVKTGSMKKKKNKQSSKDSFSESGRSDDGSSSEERTYKDSKRKSEVSDTVNRISSETTRKEKGLEWMLKPTYCEEIKGSAKQPPLEEQPEVQVEKLNPKELNPYLRDNGTGYPEDEDSAKVDQLPSYSVVGDGGASWRLKALKRAREQATREGRKLDEVVEERWGSLGKMTVSAARSRAAHAHAHLHAIKDRKRGMWDNEALENDKVELGDKDDKHRDRHYLKGLSAKNPDMKAPKVDNSLSWRKRNEFSRSGDASLFSSAASSLNKFTDDGSFLQSFNVGAKKGEEVATPQSSMMENKDADPQVASSDNEESKASAVISSNQLAAKVLQLRMKGKHDEAEKLLQGQEKLNRESANSRASRRVNSNRTGSSGAYIPRSKADDDADKHLAMKIISNKQYKASAQADDEYDFGDCSAPTKKHKKKDMSEKEPLNRGRLDNRLLTQQERCQFCFDNPRRRKDLVISIGNFSYIMLPPWEPLAEGHCCILPMQHEPSTRNLDDHVLEELRNFKKCLLMMFAEQGKDVVFLETAIALSQQRRHCLVECVPLPHDIAKDAPLYFKKAIDEAEEEWSQHNAKKLIHTSSKRGLQHAIPKNFPYFHIEFGLREGFVHVIDDETEFKSSLGLDVIRGMLELPEEDMHRSRRYGSTKEQENAATRFREAWKHFDWTKELDR